MAYTNITSRADAAALVTEEVSQALITETQSESAVLTQFKRVPVSKNQVRFPVLSALPTAGWVTGDTGLKETTEVNWASKYLNVEELACILPIPQAVLDDTDYDIIGQAKPEIAKEMGRKIDAAVFFGTNAPASFPTNINTAATAAGNANAEGRAASEGGFLGDFDDTLSLVEADGFDPTAVVSARAAKARFRGARSTTGDRVDRDRLSGNLSEIDGLPIVYTMAGLWPATVRLFVGDFANQFVVGVRQDITYTIHTEGVIQDATGAIVYNLLQQDMAALRVVFRLGWQVANTINNDAAVEANRYPAAVQTFI